MLSVFVLKASWRLWELLGVFSLPIQLAWVGLRTQKSPRRASQRA
jgi:hypothetical protein